MNKNHQEILQQVNTLMQADQPHKIISLIDTYFKTSAKTAELLSKYATAHIMVGDRVKANILYHEALEFDPNFVPALANLALMNLEAGSFLKAKNIAEKAYAIDKSNIPLASIYANILKNLGLFDDAIWVLKNAVKESPDHIETVLNLSALLIEHNRKSESLDFLNKILGEHPSNVRALMMHASIHKFNKQDDNLNRLESSLSLCDQDDLRMIDIHFALGKAYEDCKDFEKSFDHYKQGNDLFRNTYHYEVKSDEQYLKDIITHSKTIKPIVAECDYTPIFIVGMPRSGTSLVEQILASHSAVNAMGELATIERLYDSFHATEFHHLEEARQFYLSIIKHRLGNDKIFTDKMPLNFRYIGFIKVLFPQAKFIHCVRDPIDTCFSIYKKKFVGIMPFAQNLNELVQYYKLYEAQMNQWLEVYASDIMDVRYSDLVNQPKEQINQLLGFLDLPWEDDCLEFYKNKRTVTTASSEQVRQPIYKTAINYWENYKPWLGDLIKEFNL